MRVFCILLVLGIMFRMVPLQETVKNAKNQPNSAIFIDGEIVATTETQVVIRDDFGNEVVAYGKTSRPGKGRIKLVKQGSTFTLASWEPHPETHKGEVETIREHQGKIFTRMPLGWVEIRK